MKVALDWHMELSMFTDCLRFILMNFVYVQFWTDLVHNFAMTSFLFISETSDTNNDGTMLLNCYLDHQG